MNFINQADMRTLKGFTLIETAIVLLILGLVLGGLLAAVGQSSQNSRRNDTQVIINRVEEALYGFAQANGRLPCPATATSSGIESPAGGGVCTLANGFVPATTLGLQGRIDGNGLLLDAWSDALRYSVSTIAQSGSPLFTSITGMKSVFSNTSLIAVPGAQPAGLIRVCGDSVCTSILANNVPAIIFSRGPNFGSYSSANEIANSGAQAVGTLELRTGTGGFVSREYNEDSFDDIIVWLSPHVLFSRLVAAGKLP